MARRPKARAPASPSSLSATAAPGHLRHIARVIEAGGQIMLGTLQPITGAAVAHDGHKALAMLRRRSNESIPDLLMRLDAAIATAQSTGKRVDEINKASSDVRYEL
jgi:hypothetical protein